MQELLTKIARREFGAGNENAVLAAWKSFSDAIKLVPDTGPNMGTNNSVATPLFFEKPKPRAMTLDHSWEDPAIWSRTSQINPYWPYVPQPADSVSGFHERDQRGGALHATFLDRRYSTNI